MSLLKASSVTHTCQKMLNKSNVSILLFLLSLRAFSSQLVGFCFEPNISLAQVKNYIKVVSAPSDKFFERPAVNCIEATIEPARHGLFETFLSRRYKIIKKYSNSSEGSHAISASAQNFVNCSLIVRKSLRSNKVSNKVNISNRSNVSRSESESSGGSRSRLLLGQGRRGHISVNGNRVALICQGQARNGYNIDVELSDSSGNVVSTNIFVQKGIEVNLGQVLDDLNTKTKSAGLPQGILYESTKGSLQTDFFLSVE